MCETAGRLPLDPCRFCEKAATKVDRVCDEHWEQLRWYLWVRYSMLAGRKRRHLENFGCQVLSRR